MGDSASVCHINNDLFNNAWPDGLIEIDSSNYLVKNINNQVTDFLGWLGHELIGKTVHHTLCKQSTYCDHHEEACPFISYSSCSSEAKERYWVHKNQQNIAISYRIFPTNQNSILVIFQSCESLGFQVEELRKLSKFTEINPAPLLEIDSQGLILFSNTAMTDLMLNFGFNDNGIANVLPENLSELVASCFNEEVKGIESEVVNEDDPQDRRFFLWRFHPLQDPQKQMALLCGVDITHKKQMEQQQAIFEETLELEKAKARKEYLAKMVHELRSPLNAVVGYATMLKNKLASEIEGKYLDLFDRIIEGGNQLAEQISLTLESNRVEEARLQANIENFSINGIVVNLVDKLSIMANKKNLNLLMEDPDEDFRISADIQQTKQILINLISNAIKYTSTGEVKVSISNAEDEQIGPAVAIDVIDTGSGIPDSEQELIFELFQRQELHSESDIEGDGLGLAICAEMVELNHGRIILKSEFGVGSVFTVLLPKAL